jgi:hypothetical protein
MKKYIIIIENGTALTFEAKNLTDLEEKLKVYGFEERIISITIL